MVISGPVFLRCPLSIPFDTSRPFVIYRFREFARRICNRTVPFRMCKYRTYQDIADGKLNYRATMPTDGLGLYAYLGRTSHFVLGFGVKKENEDLWPILLKDYENFLIQLISNFRNLQFINLSIHTACNISILYILTYILIHLFAQGTKIWLLWLLIDFTLF